MYEVRNLKFFTLSYWLDILDFEECSKSMSIKCKRKLTIYGYSRVSTSSQDYKIQIEKLAQASDEKIYNEKYTGTKKDGRKESEGYILLKNN